MQLTNNNNNINIFLIHLLYFYPIYTTTCWSDSQSTFERIHIRVSKKKISSCVDIIILPPWSVHLLVLGGGSHRTKSKELLKTSKELFYKPDNKQAQGADHLSAQLCKRQFYIAVNLGRTTPKQTQEVAVTLLVKDQGWTRSCLLKRYRSLKISFYFCNFPFCTLKRDSLINSRN